MNKYKMVITYDGSNYCGWQIQKNGISIEGVISNTISTILQENVFVCGAGRTDSGVHAKGQVAHFSSSKVRDYRVLKKSLNALLPRDIRVLELTLVEDDFHARFSAKEKIYTYEIVTSKIQMPFDRCYALHFPFKLDVDKIEESLHYFIGKKSFLSFTTKTKRITTHEDATRTIYELSLIHNCQGFSLRFRGDGFLYRMVRNITGTLLDIGQERLLSEELPSIFISGNKDKTHRSVPPHGLTLNEVCY